MLGMNPLTLLELFGEPHFQAAFVVGLLGLVVLLLVRQAGWLLVWGVGAVVALSWTGMLRGNPASPEWGVGAVAATALVSAVAFRVLLRRVPAWSVGLVFALWVLGVWGTVPDTERAVVLMGLTTALLPGLWPGLRIRVGWEGAAVAVACLGFVAIADGAARTPSILGALGMVGMPAVAAAAAYWLPGRTLSPWWLFAAQVVHVIVSGRIAGQTVQPAVAITVVVLSALVTGGGVAFGIPRMASQPSARR